MGRKLGQHFLKDKTKLKKIASALDIVDGDFIIEIGPGHGELTNTILKTDKDINLISIERDEVLFNNLVEKYKDNRNVKIILGNALDILEDTIKEANISKYKIIGNIPYYITGNLLRKIGDLETPPFLTVLTIQKEVAERIVYQEGKFNILSASIAFWGEAVITNMVPKQFFSPPPKVDSAVIKITSYNKEPENKDAYFKVLKAAFAHPRKLLANNLSTGLDIEKNEAQKLILEVNLEPNSRPQDLSRDLIEKIATLYIKTNK